MLGPLLSVSLPSSGAIMDQKGINTLLKPVDSLHYMAKGVCSCDSLKGLLVLHSNMFGPWVITETAVKENQGSQRGRFREEEEKA